MSVVLARQTSRKDHMVRPCTKKDAPTALRGIWRTLLTSWRIRTNLRYVLLLKGWCLAPASKRPKHRIRSRYRSVNAHDERKRIKLRGIGHFPKVQKAWVFVHERLQFYRLKTLRRARILRWVGQRSTTTVDQRRRETLMHNGQLRTSCRSKVILQFRLQHRQCRNCLQQLPLKSEVTDQLQEVGADNSPKSLKNGNREYDEC